VTQLQQSRYDQLLRRVGDLKGAGSKVSDVLTELFPMIDVENIPDELLALSGYNTAMEGASLGGVAAQIGKIQLFNPVDSAKLVTVTQVSMSAQATVNMHLTFVTAEFATVAGIGLFRDTRLGVTGTPSAQVQTLTDAATVASTVVMRAQNNLEVSLSPGTAIAVLAPGTGLLVGPSAVNVAVQVSFFWRERVAEPSELNF